MNDQLQLQASGDARLKMWRLVIGQYVQNANDTPTTIVKQSTGERTYVLGVWSDTGAAQRYSVTLTK